MKVVYTEKEIDEMLNKHLKHLSGLAPEGKVAKINFNKYSDDYCVVTFVDAPKPEPTTATEAAEQAKTETPVTPIDDKPIDLSEILF